MENTAEVLRLKKIIQTEVFVTAETQRIVSTRGNESNWLFDFRKVLMRPEVLDSLGRVFLERFKDKMPLQIGTLEVAGIPLAVGIAFSLYKQGYEINSFFIRKSRKKSGLLNMVEGDVTDEAVILVDDIINSGSSFIRQVEVLESLGKKVDTIFTILRFRDESYYAYFHEKGITVEAIFTLDDFSESLPVKNLVSKSEVPAPFPFTVDWYFKSENPNYFYVVPKSTPVLDTEKIYFGSDSGNFWALQQSDGSVVWKYKVGLHTKGKSIFSSPVISSGLVYFGAYDGNFYALDTKTGKPRWIFMEADWIGSSPCIAEKLGLVFVGLEFGLFTKQGGIVALDTRTGRKVWESTTKDYIHSSPAYNDKYEIVVCGCNNNTVYAFNARDGKVIWEYVTEAEVKASFSFDERRRLVVFGSHDSYMYALDVQTGVLRFRFKTDQAIYSTPLIWADTVYVSSLDKKIYGVNLDTGLATWEFLTSGRIFSSPALHDDHIYIGSNDGRLYELDPETGKNTAIFQTVERITTKVVGGATTGSLYMQTFANEIFCLSKKHDNKET